ncbi:MAG: hypothetical protein NC206_10690 [Bacteroides sp.]|nr:hypothetical protein [Roseburia sp.]MCM1347535.1 hypothetical protein [Bacteroides sp.]MCM1422024.1 hypothetical protein [Bacteroides sp.]
MNKKYLSVLLFGAMIAASTGTFMSCKDYDDDIDGLRTEISNNATAAASELASKVEELKSQINTLESAKDKQNTELAAAKQEAATASANALAAAQKAQTAAEAAQKGGDQAAAAAAAAQQTADQAAKDLASAVARVAALETKVASLEAAVADLKNADSDFSSRLAILENTIKLNQDAIATNKNGIAENKQAIADANAAILAKATELNSAINDLSVKIGAQIDVINSELNTIKSNYATKDELNSKYQELAAMDAQLKGQIETNANYIAALQTTVKELAAKDTELAAKIESNYNSIIEKLNTTNTELTAASSKIAAIENTVSGLTSSYSSLQSAKADITYVDNINKQLTTLVQSLQSTLNDLSTSNAAQDKTIGDLLISVKALQEKTVDLQNLVDKNNSDAQAALQTAVAGLQKEIADAVVKAQDELTVAVEDVKAVAESNKAEIAQIKADLATKADQSALDALAADLLTNVTEVGNIQAELAGIHSELAEQKADLEGKIAAAEAAAKEYADAIVRKLSERVDTNAEDIKNLQDFMTELTNISGEDLSAFVTSNKLDVALNEFYDGLAQEFMGQLEFTEWVNYELHGDILSKYVTNDALAEQLGGYVAKEDYEQKIAELEKKMSNDEEGNLGFEQRIAECESILEAYDLVSLTNKISKRLTSITLIPNSYSDGIESIEFRSFRYKIKYSTDTKYYYLTNGEAVTATYRMNPSGVTEESINMEDIDYVANLATTRSVSDKLIDVAGAKIENGELVVSLNKNSSFRNKNFNDGKDGKRYIVALQVPIASDFLLEGEDEAYVYSEYAILDEKPFGAILQDKTGNSRTWSELSSSTEDENCISLTYSEEHNLEDLVKVLTDESGQPVFSDYESYGLKLKFELPEKYYIPGSEKFGNQQNFARITSDNKLVASYDGKDFAEAAKGRQPIVHVSLVDSNGNLVEDIYFKVKWVFSTENYDLSDQLFTTPEQRSYSGIGTYTYELSADDMNKVYNALDMNANSFGTNYELKNEDNFLIGIVQLKTQGSDAGSITLVWTVNENDLRAVYGATPWANKDVLPLTRKCTWVSKDGGNTVSFDLKMNISKPTFDISKYNPELENYWNNTNTVFAWENVKYDITPSANNANYSYFDLDLVNIFDKDAAKILDVINKGTYAGNAATAKVEINSTNTKYSGAQIIAVNGKPHLQLKESGTLGTATSSPTDAAKELVGQTIPLKVVINPTGEGFEFVAKEFNVEVKKPLAIEFSNVNGLFHEGNINGSTIDVSNVVSIKTTDLGYVVKNVTDGTLSGEEKDKYTQSLYKYYGVSEVKWFTANASTSLSTGKLPNGATLNYEDGKLTYQKGDREYGSDFTITIPVEVSYRWGVERKSVTIAVKTGIGE